MGMALDSIITEDATLPQTAPSSHVIVVEDLWRTYDMTQDQEAAEFKEWEMPVNQLGGVYSDFPQLVEQLSFTSVKDYEDWLARLAGFPAYIDQNIELMREGLRTNVLLPKMIVNRVKQQLDRMVRIAPRWASDAWVDTGPAPSRREGGSSSRGQSPGR